MTVVVHRQGRIWQAAGLGTFTYSGWRSHGEATTVRGRRLSFSLKGWTHGRAEIVEDGAVIGGYARSGRTGHDGVIGVMADGADRYEFAKTGGMFSTTYALRCAGQTLAEFKVAGLLGARMDGELWQDVDPVVGLFYLWLILAFHDDDAAAAAGA